MKILKLRRWMFIAILLCCTPQANGQELEHTAPTLQIGLDNLSFAKGTLDAQLIMEIIAEKQQELKLKAIQNIFLRKVEHAGGTVYSFTDNIVRELVFEHDSRLRTKRLLENTVNLVFCYVYLEYYLSKVKGVNRDNISALYKHFVPDFKVENGFKNIHFNYGDLKNYNYRKNKRVNESHREIRSILFDIVSEVIRKNQNLKQLGILQVSHSDTYNYMNEYIKIQNNSYEVKAENYTNVTRFNDTAEKDDYLKKLKEIISPIYISIKDDLELFTKHIGLINYIIDINQFNINDPQLISNFRAFDSKISNLDQIVDELTNINKEIKNQLIKYQKRLFLNNDLKAELQNLSSLKLYIDKLLAAMESGNMDTKILADVLYTFHSKIIPSIKKMSFRDINILGLIEKINLNNKLIKSYILEAIDSHGIFNNFFTDEISPFINLVSKLYEFDKSSTFTEYIKLCQDVSELLHDDDFKYAMDKIMAFIKDYTVIETDTNGKEYLTFNVESFILKLQNLKPHKRKALAFKFTVGMNNANFKDDLVVGDSSVVRNLSYVSEKIGIRVNLLDWAYWKTRNPGESYRYNGKTYTKLSPPIEPTISNLHLNLYGSGMLYNLVNTKTNSEFNMPMIAAGVGLTFYNALDFNISYGIPIQGHQKFGNSFDHSFINIGFDIQFLEYFKRLQSKRNTKKTVKQLTALE